MPGKKGETWNPMRGCRRVSEGCRFCYAENMSARFSGPGEAFEGLAEFKNGQARWTGRVTFVVSALEKPLRWSKPRGVFVNSMSDVFFEPFDFDLIAAVFGVMAAATEHTFMVLTKRPERMRAFFAWLEHEEGSPGVTIANAANMWLEAGRSKLRVGIADVWPLPNVWLGVSAEDQATAELRVPQLLETPAARRFVSAEPLLGPIDFQWLENERWLAVDALRGVCGPGEPRTDVLPSLDWVILGGESGHGARPVDEDWMLDIAQACRRTRTSVFVKQMGCIWAKSRGQRGKGTDPEEWHPGLRVQEWPPEVEVVR